MENKLKGQLEYFIDGVTKQEVKEVLNLIETESDFTYEFENGEEYRIINENVITNIYFEEQEELLAEIYPEIFEKKPWWVEIDLNKTIQNILDADGYGQLFATYDGVENEINIDGVYYYCFRIN